MATSEFNDVGIPGIVCAVPKIVRGSNEFQTVFSEEQIAKVQKMTGVKNRHIAGDGVCTSDLCVVAASELLVQLGWPPESINGLIFVSQTPDHKLPATSCLIQERLGLPNECAAFDVNLGCSGYVYGLWLASSLIAARSVNRLLLLVGDTITKIVSPRDRGTALLFGDAGSATAVEFSRGASKKHFVLGTDGSGGPNLIIPAGGCRCSSSPETIEKIVMEDGVTRSLEDLYMNGSEVLSFTLQRVAPLVSRLFKNAGCEFSEADYFVFHQANLFILRQIANKLRLDPQQVPINLDRFGNTSSASIPLVLATELEKDLSEKERKIALVGFGVGYSWAAALGDFGPLDCCRVVEV
ncbi:MAG: ketoacyl-ACP synthase III [Eubacteriales bacterium]|nr:ketoacyl-ACP synthase III [Eubacteriales bacterium]